MTNDILGPAESRPVSQWRIPEGPTSHGTEATQDVQLGVLGQMILAVAEGLTEAFMHVWDEHSEELTEAAVDLLKQKSRAVWQRRPKRRGYKAGAAPGGEQGTSEGEIESPAVVHAEPSSERPEISAEQFRRHLLQAALFDEGARRIREALREADVIASGCWPEELKEAVTLFLTDGYGALDDQGRELLFDAFWRSERSAPSVDDAETPTLETVKRSIPQSR